MVRNTWACSCSAAWKFPDVVAVLMIFYMYCTEYRARYLLSETVLNRANGRKRKSRDFVQARRRQKEHPAAMDFSGGSSAVGVQGCQLRLSTCLQPHFALTTTPSFCQSRPALLHLLQHTSSLWKPFFSVWSVASCLVLFLFFVCFVLSCQSVIL